jgi:hypothetical protein
MENKCSKKCTKDLESISRSLDIIIHVMRIERGLDSKIDRKIRALEKCVASNMNKVQYKEINN